MNTILKEKYVYEKQVFTKLLIDSRMLEITYSETFNLVFYKYIYNSEGDNKWIVRKMNLMIDAPFWVGEKSKWDEYTKSGNDLIEMDDRMLAYELINIRYCNQIQVHRVEFSEKYLCILLDDEKILSIAFCSDSDYSWILEEDNNKGLQEKVMVFCQGNEIVAKNIHKWFQKN